MSEIDVIELADVMSDRSKRWRDDGESIGLVPTMGALHEGHLALVDAARSRYDRVVVSIFVNPLQFGPGEDFERYPRSLEGDLAALDGHGVAVVFAPEASQMYPAGSPSPPFHAGPLGERFEGEHRPGHFDGVLAAVSRLFDVVRPDGAFFGHKDAQQLAVISRMVTDQALPVVIHAVDTVRAPDGLALSSRNRYLTPAEREQALVIPRALAQAALADGPVNAREAARAEFVKARVELEYLEVVEPGSFVPVGAEAREGRLILACRLGKTRLIDNELLRFGQ